MYWCVGYECIDCAEEAEIRESEADARYINASIALELLKDAGFLVHESSHPECASCGGFVVVWWTGNPEYDYSDS